MIIVDDQSCLNVAERGNIIFRDTTEPGHKTTCLTIELNI